ncbi:MAG: HAMP domain-containing protein [Clostridia bacterium]|nr:HAMP domain-containing protein [Clostridia bacterium]
MFLLIVGLSFSIMANSLTNMVGDYLFEQRIRTDTVNVESLAVRIAPMLARKDTEALYEELTSAGGEIGGRLMVLDRFGKVQVDTYAELNGMRVDYPEVASVLVRGDLADYGVHPLDGSGVITKTGNFLLSDIDDFNWVGYCTAGVIDQSDVIGVVLLSSPVQTMMANLYELRDQMLVIFIAVAVIAIVFCLVFSQIITKPMTALTRSIQTMARGDFSTRVKVRGSGEMRRLARTFNSMSEKIESLDQARNQFVSNASHELKTPLATMKIMIESLIYQPEMEVGLRTEFMTDINREIDRLSSVVTDLLTLVRMDVKDVKLSRENMSLAALVKDTRHLLTTMIEKRKQTVTLSIQDDCDMYADRTKLQQVVYNLMENAVKYTQEGGEVSVTLQRIGRDAVLTVKDNGPGISAEHLPHIFDRFYRVDKARSREAGGTGLGLAIVHQLVMLHGGEIHVESEEGKGTAFSVELPLHMG